VNSGFNANKYVKNDKANVEKRIRRGTEEGAPSNLIEFTNDVC
jgi:hypothetical protein